MEFQEKKVFKPVEITPIHEPAAAQQVAQKAMGEVYAKTEKAQLKNLPQHMEATTAKLNSIFDSQYWNKEKHS